MNQTNREGQRPGDTSAGKTRPRPQDAITASVVGMFATVALGIGIQGIVKGGSARPLGIVTIILAALVVAKSFAVTTNFATKDSGDGPAVSVKPPSRLVASLTSPGRWIVRSSRIGSLTLLLAFGLAMMAGLDVKLTAEPVASYPSAYDGVDPVSAGCARGEGIGTVVTSRKLWIGHRHAGTLYLEYSEYCGTHWARIYLNPPYIDGALGSVLHLSVIRPADDQHTPYSVVVSRQPSGAPPLPYAWGNMTGGGVCAIATAWDNGIRHGFKGFSARTSCGNLPKISPRGAG